MRSFGWILCLTLLAAAPAGAVLIASGDGSGNTTAPADDPGFANVGTRGSLSAVYLGDGWVVTAAHVGAGDVTLEGRSYPAQPGTTLRLLNQDGSEADLIAFRIEGDPGLPALQVAQATPAVGSDLVMVGHGRNRGEALEWFERPGFPWAAGNAMRWGTNQVSGVDADFAGPEGPTRGFFTDFSLPGTLHEAQAAPGDSGGAVFAAGAQGWELAGVMVAIQAPFQPGDLALDGNLTYAADLAHYRDQLVAAGALPQPGEPELTLGTDRVFFGVTWTGNRREVRIPLANVGAGALRIDAVELATSGDLSAHLEAPLPLELASPELDPAASRATLVVRWSPGSGGWHVGTVSILSNDPSQPRAEIRLYGYALGGGWGR